MAASPAEDLAALRLAYWRETRPIIRQRLTVAMALFVLFMGIGTIVEAREYPARRDFALLLYAIEAVAALAGAGLSWLPALRRCSVTIASVVLVAIIACICVYHAEVGAPAERVAIVLGCVLNLTSVLLPWGWVPQAAVAIGAGASFGWAAAHLVTIDTLAVPAVVLAAAATNSVAGAFFLDRYRFETFHRATLAAEEADIAAALARVGETLSRHLGQPDVLEQVNRLALAMVRCDWSSLFLFNEARGVYRLAANVGSQPDTLAMLKQVEFPPDSLPLLRSLRPGELVEIRDTDQQSLVPIAMLRQFEVASAIYAPVARGDRIIGTLVNGWRTRTGAFSSREQRLTLGIAHATAIALENGRLIGDLQDANRLKSEFVATMSHELRTPLNVIMGYAEMLADRAVDPDDPEWGNMLGSIQARAVELFHLVNATLDLGRIEAGRETVVLGTLEVGQLFAELGRELGPLAPPEVRLVWRQEAGTAPLLTDRHKIKTVLKNLVGNALKFTNTGTVEVLATLADRRLQLAVRDTGIGIAQEHLSVIFDMFRQVDSSPTRRFGGVGLGLHIVRRLVDLLGGTIEVASELGRGTVFTVTVPDRAGGEQPDLEAASV